MNRASARVAMSVALVLVALGGCKLGKGPTIEEILAEPSRYDGKVLTVKGTVRATLQFFGYGGCSLDDGTGRLTVITAGKSRSTGQEVAIKGTVKSAFNLGGKTMVVLIEEGAKAPDGKG